MQRLGGCQLSLYSLLIIVLSQRSVVQFLTLTTFIPLKTYQQYSPHFTLHSGLSLYIPSNHLISTCYTMLKKCETRLEELGSLHVFGGLCAPMTKKATSGFLTG